jgi:type IV secretory pathway TraG/TraD family ATPase VirD4
MSPHAYTEGIKAEDRFSHIYIIGKTGTGKSTLLETMAMQDMEWGNGFALIDPHGDLVERIAKRIPRSRQADVIYLNAADPTQPYGYNPLRYVSEHLLLLPPRA